MVSAGTGRTSVLISKLKKHTASVYFAIGRHMKNSEHAAIYGWGHQDFRESLSIREAYLWIYSF